jgi:tight adherence protein C
MQEFLQSPSAPWVLGGAIAFSLFFIVYSFVAGAQQIMRETETVDVERSGLILFITPILRRLTVFTSMIQSDGLNKYRRELPLRMTRAGMENFMVPEEYVAFHVFAAMCPLPVMAYLNFIVLGQPFMSFVIFSMPLCLLGAVYPSYYISRKIAERQKTVFRELPSVLDLMTVSVEAGLDFMGGLNLVVEKGRPSCLRDELARMMKQLQLGVTRVDGLRELSHRSGQKDLASVVAALVQATKLGSSLGPILRIQSSALRERRSQIAEELANKAPVKIIFPIVAFIFPSIFLILLGPVLIKTYYNFQTQ